MAPPKSSDVLRALRQHMQVRTHAMRRFNTGLAHYVYEIMTDGEPVVVRMADPDHWNGIPGGVYWHDRLRETGVPLPRMFGYDLNAAYPYMILERLPGVDLGEAYARLTPSQKRSIALEVVEVQNKVAALPHADHYGWLSSYENPTEPYLTWHATLESGLIEAHEFITRIGIFDPAVVEQTRAAAKPYARYIDAVAPAPFLDDTTTKNVLIHNGSLSGIVDVDNVCFGDRLYVLALTNMALLSSGFETSYIDAWAAAWELDAAQIRVMKLYTAMHGVYFMSEIGRSLNKDKPIEADEAHVQRLKDVVKTLLEQVEAR